MGQVHSQKIHSLFVFLLYTAYINTCSYLVKNYQKAVHFHELFQSVIASKMSQLTTSSLPVVFPYIAPGLSVLWSCHGHDDRLPSSWLRSPNVLHSSSRSTKDPNTINYTTVIWGNFNEVFIVKKPINKIFLKLWYIATWYIQQWHFVFFKLAMTFPTRWCLWS